MRQAASWTRRVGVGLLSVGAVTLALGLAGCGGSDATGITPETDPNGAAMKAKLGSAMEEGKNAKPVGKGGAITAPMVAPPGAPAAAPK